MGMKKRFKLRAIVLGVILSNMLSLTAMAAKETQAEWRQSFQELTEAVEKLSEDSTQEEIKDVQSLSKRFRFYSLPWPSEMTVRRYCRLPWL